MRGGHLRLIAVATFALCASVAVAQLDVNLHLANERLAQPNQTASTTATTVAAAVASKPHPKSPAGKANAAKVHDIEHSEIGKHAAANDEDADEYTDDYEYNEYYDDVVNAPKKSDKNDKKQVIVKKQPLDTWNLQPIKGNDQNTLEDEKHQNTPTSTSKPKVTKQDANQLNEMEEHSDDDGPDNDDDDVVNTLADKKHQTTPTSTSKPKVKKEDANHTKDMEENSDDDGPDNDDDDDYDINEDSDDDDEYIEEMDDDIEQTVVTSTSTSVRPQRTHKPTAAPTDSLSWRTNCPMNCVCLRNYNGYMVANCDRLDPETMHFDHTITDLEVTNVSPKYPLLFGADFFERIGLKHVNSIRIVDATIENIHPDAFRGMDQLYSVNLTNTGLDMLPPDAFANAKKLRILTLSGNDLHAMQAKHSPFVDYMLNAPSIEELYLSRCNIKQLLPTAFDKLPNVVFISLAENMLVTLPHNIFHKLTALEEIDLSSNSIENLPRHIFDNTSLSILTMRYNEMSGRPAFVAHELQKLDLSYNKLVNVNDMFFTDMPNLNNLALKGNAIRKVHHAAFAPLKDLRHIDLSFNDLEQVSAILFLENGYLDTIRMNDNARLKKLPMDGFASTLKDFNVYLFDASNCDLSELGDNTFVTMPRLTVLNLSWNNLEGVGNGLFAPLSKLVKLDLSNNLIGEVSEMVLLHNRNLRKLNLAGNPLEKLSSRVFLPTKQLTELDVSDCNLKAIWNESLEMAGYQPKNLLKNLKSLNVSNNEIAHVRQADLQMLERLSVFDLSNNKLACDREFRDLMKWLEKKKIAAGELRSFTRESLSAAELAAMTDKRSPWEEYSLLRCKKLTTDAPRKVAAVTKPKQELTYAIDDGGLESEDDGPDADDDEIVDSINDKANENDEYDDDDGPDDDDDVAEKEVKLTASVVDHGIQVTEVEKPKLQAVDNADKDSEYSEEDEDDDDDDDEEDEDDVADKTKKNVVDAQIDDDNDSGDDDDDGDDEDDDSFESLRVTYMQYGYLVPMLLVVGSVFVIMLSVAKIVSVMMRRRGERYRQALLASKNSIVYQKLSEEIGAPVTPKFHRYAPIEQV